MTIFDDLPLGMTSESGGSICYIRSVPHSLIRELAKLTSDWLETLYLNVAEVAVNPILNELSREAQQMIGDAQGLGYEMLAFRPALEAGNVVYRNERGEIHPIVADTPANPIGIALNSGGIVTVVSTGFIQGDATAIDGWLYTPASDGE